MASGAGGEPPAKLVPCSLYDGGSQWRRVMKCHVKAATAARARGLGAEDVEARLELGAYCHPLPLPLSRLRPRLETVLFTTGSAGDEFVPPTDDLRLEYIRVCKSNIST
jgi:hypothetical protein